MTAPLVPERGLPFGSLPSATLLTGGALAGIVAATQQVAALVVMAVLRFA